MTKVNYYLVLIGLIAISCQKTNPPIDPNKEVDWSDSITLYGSASLGLDLYLNQPDLDGRSCLNCHLSPTGFDLVFFGKSDLRNQDSIVLQRAVFDAQTGHGHVSLDDAYHVAAYLRSLRISSQIIPNNNAAVIPQPTGVSPSNVWDGITSLSEAQIQGWDFKNSIAISFDFPHWFAGDETNLLTEDNTDFIPEIDLLSDKEGDVRTTFEVYVLEPSNENFLSLMKAAHNSLTEGERNPGEHNYDDFAKSFDYQRWMATLYFQHVIDPGNDFEYGDELSQDIASFSISDALWDAGNVARRSQDNGDGTQEIPNRLQNELGWLYMGWLTNYGARNSFETQYLSTALKEYGEEHLATLVILKSLVSRSDHSQLFYDDLFSLSFLARNELLYQSLLFSCDYLLTGLNNNEDRFLLLYDEQVNVTKNNLASTKQNINSNTYINASQKQILESRIDSLVVFVTNM
jgi:hypothetical protein|tara:strand:+ start:425 stop:1804 length:1380 start_codon:yes stop_codon:yes gene_type:complete